MKRSKREAAGWHVYVLRCGDGSLYTGIARDVEARLRDHESGSGARYTRGRGPLVLVHVEPAVSHGAALRREVAIKLLRREAKEALVKAWAAEHAPGGTARTTSPGADGRRPAPLAPPRPHRGLPARRAARR